MKNDDCCKSEAPLACQLDAISASDRPRYNELRRMLAASVVGQRELPNGVALKISTASLSLVQLAEWIALERKCCPFFEFKLEVAPESGPVWLSLTGGAGVKEFLAQVSMLPSPVA
jgi:hypothetical protein